MQIERQDFPSADRQKLAARLDVPDGAVKAYALFAHCFTCGKDVFAAIRIAEALAERGIAMLHFDFTRLGTSEGDFANTNFSSNVADLVAAADFIRSQGHAPKILIGHSLGGAAELAAAEAKGGRSERPNINPERTFRLPDLSHPHFEFSKTQYW